jgi:HK97 family phage portal protein
LQKRSIFQKLIGGFNSTIQYFTRYKMMNGYSPIFTPFGNNAYASDVVRSTVHSIASNAAKLKPKHIRRIEGSISPQNSSLEKLLTVRPNPHMNAYDFYYKVVTQLYMKNNAFILIQSDGFNVVGFYPIVAANVELLEYQDELFARFTFGNGRTVTVSYNDVIHLRRYFYENDMFGESNSDALFPTLELIHTANEGISNAVKSSANLRGLLKFTQAMMKPEDLKKQRDEFVADYMDVNNNGGVAALDAKADYTPLNNDPKMVNGPQMKLIEEKVYKYFNVNESIVMSKYNENEWNAFYESVIEPLAVQMSLEFTSKLFSDRARGFGNEIIFEANRLQYASTTTKINVIKTLMPMGLLSINEGREVLNLAPVEDGDKRIVSLNYVNADKADKYQVGEEGGKDGKAKEGTPINGDPGGTGSE